MRDDPYRAPDGTRPPEDVNPVRYMAIYWPLALHVCSYVIFCVSCSLFWNMNCDGGLLVPCFCLCRFTVSYASLPDLQLHNRNKQSLAEQYSTNGHNILQRLQRNVIDSRSRTFAATRAAHGHHDPYSAMSE